MIKIFNLFVCVMLLLGCSSVKKGLDSRSKDHYNGNLSTKDRVHFDKVFYAANKAKVLGDYDEAADLSDDGTVNILDVIQLMNLILD